MLLGKRSIKVEKSANESAGSSSSYNGSWEKKELNDMDINYRVVTGLQIKNVNSVKYINFKSKQIFYNLLAITCEKANITFNLSMSSKIKLDCKKIDAIIEDIDIPWPTKLKPLHK